MTTLQKLNGCLALANAAFTGQQNTFAVNLHQNTVAGHTRGQSGFQIGDDGGNDGGGGILAAKERHIMLDGHFQAFQGRLNVPGDEKSGEFVSKEPVEGHSPLLGREFAHIAHFHIAHNLQTHRLKVVKIPSQLQSRTGHILNGQLDLTQAEAVIDLIEADSADAAANAAGQVGGTLQKKLDPIYHDLTDLCSHFHAVLDYPDEDIEDFLLESYSSTLSSAEESLSRLLSSFDRGRVMREGVPAVILGKPNAGKSSLLNALLGYERAIVTDIPGTTRDTITEKVRLGRVLLRLTDTAGLRETSDAVERIGVDRALAAAEEAQLALVLTDPTDEDGFVEVLKSVQHIKHIILIFTKADIKNMRGSIISTGELRADSVISLSSLTGQGIEVLTEAVEELYPLGQEAQGEILTNSRHADAVSRALESIRAAKDAMDFGLTPDAVLVEVEEAMAALGELSGKTVREDITSRIFERFCVGK